MLRRLRRIDQKEAVASWKPRKTDISCSVMTCTVAELMLGSRAADIYFRQSPTTLWVGTLVTSNTLYFLPISSQG